MDAPLGPTGVDARERAALIAQFAPLVDRIVSIYAHAGFPWWVRDDLTQEGMVGLITAVDRLDNSKGNFGLYAKFWITKFVRRAVAKATRERQERSVDLGRPEPSEDPRLQSLIDEVWRVIETLEPIEQRVITASFGLIQYGPRSIAAIAADNGMSISRTRSIRDRAKLKIAKRLQL